MWARVKGKTENALLRLPFRASYMVRPGYIQPRHGIVSKTRLYRVGYTIMGPLFPLLRRLAPKYVITTEDVGRSMLQIAKHGADKRVLENHELGALSRAYSRPGADLGRGRAGGPRAAPALRAPRPTSGRARTWMDMA